MMQLGDMALEAEAGGDASLATEWYRKASRGDPPQPDALFQIARIYHEVGGSAVQGARVV